MPAVLVSALPGWGVCQAQRRTRSQQHQRCRAAPVRVPVCSAAHAPPLAPAVALRPSVQHAQLVASIAAAKPPERRAPSAVHPLQALSAAGSQTLAISLPAWLALALTAFLSAFAGLFATCLVALLPTLREVTLSAQSVRTAAGSVVTACKEVEELSVLMMNDIRQVEEGISKPLATLSSFSKVVGKQALQGIIDDPDTQLLRSVAGSVRVTTEKTIRERVRKWMSSLETIRERLQADAESNERMSARRRASARGEPSGTQPQQLSPPAPRLTHADAAAGAERAAVQAWAGAASAVALAESAAAKLEVALDTCELEGACGDQAALAAAAEAAQRDAAEAALDAAAQPSNPS